MTDWFQFWDCLTSPAVDISVFNSFRTANRINDDILTGIYPYQKIMERKYFSVSFYDWVPFGISNGQKTFFWNVEKCINYQEFMSVGFVGPCAMSLSFACNFVGLFSLSVWKSCFRFRKFSFLIL